MTLKEILQRQVDRLNNMIKAAQNHMDALIAEGDQVEAGRINRYAIPRLQEMVILRFERLNEKELAHD